VEGKVTMSDEDNRKVCEVACESLAACFSHGRKLSGLSVYRFFRAVRGVIDNEGNRPAKFF